MADKYGADATRLSLIVGAAPGTDTKLAEDRIRGYKNFANKVWNISRFVLESCDKRDLSATLSEADAKLLGEARIIAAEVGNHIESFRLDLAADSIYHFAWDRFAAEIIEESKAIIKAGSSNPSEQAAREADSRARMLYESLIVILKTLHPFMPFVTEAIWQKLPAPSGVEGPGSKDTAILMVAPWVR
jgi:valyl-tRNA synthetase